MKTNLLELEGCFDNIVDNLGKKIDDGIKEAVVILTKIGFKTSASCEGHLNWGFPFPWIDIEDGSQNSINKMQNLLNIYGKHNFAIMYVGYQGNFRFQQGQIKNGNVMVLENETLHDSLIRIRGFVKQEIIS